MGFALEETAAELCSWRILVLGGTYLAMTFRKIENTFSISESLMPKKLGRLTPRSLIENAMGLSFGGPNGTVELRGQKKGLASIPSFA